MPALVIIIIVMVVVFNVNKSARAARGAQNQRGVYSPPKVQAQRQQPRRAPAPAPSRDGHLCRDKRSHKMTFGAAGGDLTDEVDAMNRRNQRIAGPLRLTPVTAAEIAEKRAQLESLLEGGIIDRDEYNDILMEFRNSRTL